MRLRDGLILALALLFGELVTVADAQQMMRIQPNALAQRAAVDQLLFQPQGSVEALRQQMLSRVEAAVDELDRYCQLTDEQRAKLELAGRGDASRLMREIRMIREKFSGAFIQQGDAEIQQMFNRAQQLRTDSENLTALESSLFSKVRRQILNPEQVEKIRAVENQELLDQIEMHVLTAVNYVERHLPIVDEERKALATVYRSMVEHDLKGEDVTPHLLVVTLLDKPKAEIERLVSPRFAEELSKAGQTIRVKILQLPAQVGPKRLRFLPLFDAEPES